MTGVVAAATDPAVPYRGVRVLVLGGSGFIGGWLLRSLAGAGATVHAVARNESGADRIRRLGAARVTVADLIHPGTVTTIVREAAPDVIFNLAAYGVDRAERDESVMSALNTRLVTELCAAAVTHQATSGWSGLRLVHAGSALEYGSVSGLISENTVPIPHTDYGRTKLAGSNVVLDAVRSAGLAAAVVRLFTVYGSGEHAGRLLPSLIDAARTGDAVHLSSGEQPRDFTYVEDVVSGLLRVGRSAAASGVLNVATGRLTTVRQFAELAAGIMGIPGDRLRFGAISQRAGEMFHGAVDTSRAEQLLGWSPRISIADGISRTWELEQN